jgi:predicted nucleotidyltransferase
MSVRKGQLRVFIRLDPEYAEGYFNALKREETMERSRIAIDRERLARFCRRNYIHGLALFGSVLRDDFRPDSDVDVLVEFEPDHVPGLRFFALETELSEILGSKVDLNTPSFLSPYFRGRVLAEAEVQYVAL